MKQLFTLLITAALFSACKPAAEPTTPSGETLLIKINQESVESPVINITDYTLITSNPAADSVEAGAILKVKRALPMAMQQKDSTLFENALAKSFTYRAADEFFTRKDYISNRMNGKWALDTAKYQNVALQIFGDVAVLTYHNSIVGTDGAGKPEAAHHAWTDIFVKEAGKWKMGSIHEIRAEKLQ